ncbi:MAG: gas vesicle protein [Desulfobacter sp.]
MPIQRTPPNSAVQSTNIADLLERVLDKGVVIAGDIRISLVNVELLTIQLRLVICSVEKAEQMGMDWWVNNPVFSSKSVHRAPVEDTLDRISRRLDHLEQAVAPKQP